jgi:eukaryotic-like serine/threonine-protein kinase
VTLNLPPADSADRIFLALADVDPAERSAALDRWCAGNPQLRFEVETLLASLDVPDGFLDPQQMPAFDAETFDAPLQPGAQLGGFLVLRAIGSGGMGIVYAAQQDRPRRTVAIKVLRRSARRREVMKRFELEAEVLGRLQHPGIAQVFAFHQGDRTTPAHLVMELVDGPPITEYAQAHNLPFMARVTLAADVCDAVQHAHERGIVHRDLKPANVLVTQDGQSKVLDFGIAHATASDLRLSTIHTQHGQLIGTMSYMSPEQLRGSPNAIGARTDVYALGVLFYRLLSGRLPFEVRDVPFAEAIRGILDVEPTPLGMTDADLRGPLETIIHRAMARHPADRYPSAAALAADLRAYAEGRLSAVAARPLPARLFRRRRQSLTVIAMGIVIAALVVYALWQRQTISRLERDISTLRKETMARP